MNDRNMNQNNNEVWFESHRLHHLKSEEFHQISLIPCINWYIRLKSQRKSKAPKLTDGKGPICTFPACGKWWLFCTALMSRENCFSLALSWNFSCPWREKRDASCKRVANGVWLSAIRKAEQGFACNHWKRFWGCGVGVARKSQTGMVPCSQTRKK